MSSGNNDETHSVQLVVYDLAHGMARNLSMQFLGPDHAIDIIPHTGIIVFGKEYYFGSGSGIQCDDPIVFRRTHGNMEPIDRIELGPTPCKQVDFDRWCDTNTKYGGTSYDLLRNNCNNFTNDAMKQILFPTTEHVYPKYPAWILEIPNRVLSSPMGSLLQPILQNMQVLSSTPTSNSNNASNPRATTISSSSTSQTNTNPWATSATITPSNPWADSSIAMKPTSTSSLQSDTSTTPFIDALQKPILSHDTRLMPNSIDTLLQYYDDSTATRDPDVVRALKRVRSILLAEDSKPQIVGKDVVDTVCASILQILETVGNCPSPDTVVSDNKPGSSSASPSTRMITTHALTVLRVLVLHSEERLKDDASSVLNKCFHIIHQSVSSIAAATKTARGITTTPSIIMAWLVVSNSIGCNQIQVASPPADQQKSSSYWIDTALENLSHDRTEIRQAITAVLYNATLQVSKRESDDEISDVMIAILCGVIDGYATEKDSTTRIRRLMILGRCVRRQGTQDDSTTNVVVKSLLVDLDFRMTLKDQQSKATGTIPKEEIKLIQEILVLLQ